MNNPVEVKETTFPADEVAVIAEVFQDVSWAKANPILMRILQKANEKPFVEPESPSE